MKQLFIGILSLISITSFASDVCIVKTKVEKSIKTSNQRFDVQVVCSDATDSSSNSIWDYDPKYESKYGSEGGLSFIKANAINKLIEKGYQVKTDEMLVKP